MTSQSSSPWATGRLSRSGPFPRRSLEIGAIVVGFIYWWPVGLALVAWKLAGYPAFTELRDQRAGGPSRISTAHSPRPGSPAPSRRPAAATAAATRPSTPIAGPSSTVSRLSGGLSRRRAAPSIGFVEELKRAKDREQFDAFMAKRRS